MADWGGIYWEDYQRLARASVCTSSAVPSLQVIHTLNGFVAARVLTYSSRALAGIICFFFSSFTGCGSFNSCSHFHFDFNGSFSSFQCIVAVLLWHVFRAVYFSSNSCDKIAFCSNCICSIT